MKKIQPLNEWDTYYEASHEPTLINVGPLHCLTVAGTGSPYGDDSDFMQAIEALYPVAFSIQQQTREEGNDFVVPKMEALWWVPEGMVFEETPPHQWCWKILIPMPECVSESHFLQAKQLVDNKKDLPMLEQVRWERVHEGPSAQILHIGSYEAEKPTLEKLYAFVHQQGKRLHGRHHEIYLNDPSKTPVERLQTILRYPVAPVEELA